MRVRVVAAVALAVCVWGCASGGSTPQTTDAGPDTDATVEDTADVAPEPDLAPDLAEDPTDPPEPDTRCTACCPGDTRCADGELVATEVCNEEGTAWEAGVTCANLESCEAGACVTRCEPGATLCRDAENQQTCDVGGQSWTARRCSEGRCVGGACGSGALTGASCDADDACAGGACLCKGDRPCPPDAFPDGYCTTADCAVDGCEPAREICVDFASSGAFGGGNHCVRYCAECPRELGLRCRLLPVIDGDDITWQEGCFATYPRDMGGQCATNADCLGGLCWTGDDGPRDGLGYCTYACEDHEDCPGNSSCVRFPGREGTFCGVHCGDGDPGSGPCPENRGVATRCRNLEAFDARRLINICEPVPP